MDLFHTLDEVKPFVFRITDNGGATADRYTIALCDGSYVSMSKDPYNPAGVCLSGENFDPAITDARVEEGIEHDIRWIDLPKDCQRSFFEGENAGYYDWLSAFSPPQSRDEAQDISELSGADKIAKGIFGVEGEYYVLNEEVEGPFKTLREAVLYTLPDENDLSGPEYHPTIDIWEEGIPEPAWQRHMDPPMLDEDSSYAHYALLNPEGKPIGWFANEWDAENYLELKVDDPNKADTYTIKEI